MSDQRENLSKEMQDMQKRHDRKKEMKKKWRETEDKATKKNKPKK